MVSKDDLFGIMIVALIIGGIISGVYLVLAFYSVGVGEAGLIVDPVSHSISEPILGTAWGLKPIWATMKIIYYATDKYEDTIPCFTSDQLEMGILIQIRWNLDVSKIRDLYLSYPQLNYKSAIESVTEQIVKTVTKDYTALDTIAKRTEVIEKIQTAVLNGLTDAPSLKGALASLEFNLRDITYPAAYTAAIEAKLVAQQQQIQAEFEKQKILILANAAAQEAVLRAKGEAEAKILVSEGTREAIENILMAGGVTNSTQITSLYLWTETLKQLNVSSFIIVTGEDGVPIIYQMPNNSTEQ